MAGFEGERIEPEQTFNMPLQDQNIVLENIDDFFLRIIKAADDFFFQQGNALTQSGQRCFEFVGNVPQRLLTACFQLVETLTQPVEAVTNAAQVGRAANFDRIVETAFAQAGDRRLQFFDRARQPAAHEQCDDKSANETGDNRSGHLNAVLLEFCANRRVLFINPLAILPVDRTVDLVKAIQRRLQCFGRFGVAELAAKVAQCGRPVVDGSLRRQTGNLTQARNGSKATIGVGVEAHQQRGILEYDELAYCSFEVNGALREFLHRIVELQGVIAG